MMFRLVPAPRIWQQQLRRLVADGTVADARLNRAPLQAATELVARSLDPNPHCATSI